MSQEAHDLLSEAGRRFLELYPRESRGREQFSAIRCNTICVAHSLCLTRCQRQESPASD